MHSFHHSRGRILFEVACALTVSASCVAAWMDLGIPAFLAAAAASALYAFVHLFDMRGRNPAAAFAAPAVELDAESQGDLLAYVDAPASAPAADPAASFVELVEEPTSVEEAPPVEEPEPVAEAEPLEEPAPAPRAKKRRSSKKAEPVAEAEPVVESEPVHSGTPFAEVEPTEESEPFAASSASVSDCFCFLSTDSIVIVPDISLGEIGFRTASVT